jgi:hypothetical protein
MATHQPEGAGEAAESSGYFLVRVHYPLATDVRELSGMIERLGRGEKRSFRSGEELLRMLTAWPAAPASQDRR